MTDADRVPDDIDEALNPHRDEEQRRAAEHAVQLLRGRGVMLRGDESTEQLADLLAAVERFEIAVQARGGDSMVNTPDSSRPENPAYVLPVRRGDEPVDDYILRIVHATDRVMRGGG
ncbi:MAG TPA: hypothetical protein VNK43_12635 [Gemmatimonadales bacterium]|nr:hypothetical protein [Gemmatimonadales bacterium]